MKKIAIALVVSAGCAAALVCGITSSRSNNLHNDTAVTEQAKLEYARDEVRTAAEFANASQSKSIRAFCDDEYSSAFGRARCREKQRHGLERMRKIYSTAVDYVDNPNAGPFETRVALGIIKCREDNRHGLIDWERTRACATATIHAAEDAIDRSKLRTASQN